MVYKNVKQKTIKQIAHRAACHPTLAEEDFSRANNGPTLLNLHAGVRMHIKRPSLDRQSSATCQSHVVTAVLAVLDTVVVVTVVPAVTPAIHH